MIKAMGIWAVTGHKPSVLPISTNWQTKEYCSTDFYAHPICSPSRAALMTGSYAPRTGFADVQLWGSPFGLHPDEVTIAEVLKTKGYATAAVGKWHLGEQDAFAPNRQGFDFFYGIRLVNGTQVFENFAVPLYRDDSLLTIRPDHARMTQDFTHESLRFIDQHKEGPFFLYLAFTMPHIPIYPGERFRGESGVSLYADAIEEIDWSVGQIVEKLEQENLDENTLIIYTSDNGPVGRTGNTVGQCRRLEGKQNVYLGRGNSRACYHEVEERDAGCSNQ